MAVSSVARGKWVSACALRRSLERCLTTQLSRHSRACDRCCQKKVRAAHDALTLGQPCDLIFFSCRLRYSSCEAAGPHSCYHQIGTPCIYASLGGSSSGRQPSSVRPATAQRYVSTPHQRPVRALPFEIGNASLA